MGPVRLVHGLKGDLYLLANSLSDELTKEGETKRTNSAKWLFSDRGLPLPPFFQFWYSTFNFRPPLWLTPTK